MLEVQILKGEVVLFDFVESPKIFFDEEILKVENFIGDVKISGEVADEGSRFVVRGKIECQKNFICDRCLTKSTENQTHFFDEEVEEKNITENFLDITELVRDIILSEQPIQNLCKKNCRGLCPVCGINLNEGECNCDRLIIDPRLAPLKSLKFD